MSEVSLSISSNVGVSVVVISEFVPLSQLGGVKMSASGLARKSRASGSVGMGETLSMSRSSRPSIWKDRLRCREVFLVLFAKACAIFLRNIFNVIAFPLVTTVRIIVDRNGRVKHC